MIKRAVLSMILALVSGAVFGQSISLNSPNAEELVEGNQYDIAWHSAGVETVSLIIHGTRTPLGTVSRGAYSIVVAHKVDAELESVTYRLPWLDSIRFTIVARGYDAGGREVTETVLEYAFRPKVLANRWRDGIYLDLNRRVDQRLYVEKDRSITRCYICSSSENYRWLPPNHHIAKPHDHAGVFHVISKSPNHRSVLFSVDMPWAMQYNGGHFIHATSLRLYRLLGRAASHGCNRLTRSDAHALYLTTPLRMRVEVIGPKG